MDAVCQYGYLDVFITISPYEWTFPTPVWLQNAAEISGKMPTQLATLETLNIGHVLEQTVQGYLCGTNSLHWRQHLFNYDKQIIKRNVTFFIVLNSKAGGRLKFIYLYGLKICPNALRLTQTLTYLVTMKN